nr:ribosomal protein S19 [Swertia tetraptera]
MELFLRLYKTKRKKRGVSCDTFSKKKSFCSQPFIKKNE